LAKTFGIHYRFEKKALQKLLYFVLNFVESYNMLCYVSASNVSFYWHLEVNRRQAAAGVRKDWFGES